MCPYHVVLKFFGFKVPEKKANQQAAVAQAPQQEAVADNRVKAE